MITVNAYAKINLALDILSKRDDGYHEVSMIMQSISLCDILSCKRCTDSGIDLTIKGNNSGLLGEKDNLIHKAANLFFSEIGEEFGLQIRLEKNIPIAAGLAGGSADAAATLFVCNELSDLKLSEKKLSELGAKVGADVPFCMTGGTALAFGIGDRLECLSALPAYPLCIAVPDIHVSTPYIYGEFDKMYRENRYKAEASMRPNIKEMLACIKRNAPLTDMTPHMKNVLEAVTLRSCPSISALKNIMMKNGAMFAQMSGSGPSVFGIFNNESDALNAAEIIRAADNTVQTAVCSCYPRGLEYEMD